jgi:hypothetical protein
VYNKLAPKFFLRKFNLPLILAMTLESLSGDITPVGKMDQAFTIPLNFETFNIKSNSKKKKANKINK